MMDNQEQNDQDKVEQELEDLKKELGNFEKEKERVRAIVGQIGGVPKTQVRLVNAVFIVILIITVAISLVADEKWRLIMIELATVTLSVKIIYLIHAQMRVAHFEFWILSSLEWRINEVMKQVRQIKKDIGKS
jgi:hypothetical protein